MATEHAERLARHSVPETDFLPPAGRDPLSVRTEQSGRGGLPFVRAEDGERLARCRVPKAECPVLTAGGDPPSIRIERDGPYRSLMADEPRQQLAGCHVPYADGMVLGPGGETFTVRAIHIHILRRLWSTPADALRAGRRVPHADPMIDGARHRDFAPDRAGDEQPIFPQRAERSWQDQPRAF